ncbi:glycerophosphocholine cholinephosphodiesterase ENPP6-like [Saccostrea cucullata]|uniref:glycerophosphocholine cholinephosphodiesterase ENPP6-like n=1 Tax=Saccostrea cuccullata TaxID=36930 RepID=UPI002ED24E48
MSAEYRKNLKLSISKLTLLIFFLLCIALKNWDYFDNVDMPGFEKMSQDGVQAKYIVPDYPSISYPNFHYLMTGLHCESHGMVGNFMYDTTYDKNFLIGLNPDQSLPFWWNDAEPLWVTAEKQGRKSYMFNLPGCDATIQGVTPTYCERYTRATLVSDFEYSLQQTMELLKNNTADLIGIYLEVIDLFGHRYGVNSLELNNMLEKVDKTLGNFRQNLTSSGLDNDVNLMIFSDHGIINTTKIVNTTDSVDLTDIQIIFQEPSYVTVWPEEGMTEKVYNDLMRSNKPNITIHKKDSLPDRYHIKNHRRTAPIVIDPDNGVAVISPWKCSECDVIPSGTKDIGIHGFDNLFPEMRAIFRATGPAFKKNYKHGPLANIELYQIMCNILGLKPNAHNGIWNNVKFMIAKGSQFHISSFIVVFFM